MWSQAVDLITGLGIIGVAATIWSVRKGNRLQFEQHFTDRYRTVIARVPLSHLTGTEASHRPASEPNGVERAYFDYFELCEEQFYYRRSGRISNTTWSDWQVGITSNARLPSFQSAWREFAALRVDHRNGWLFDELVQSRAFDIGETTIDPIEGWRLQALLKRLDRLHRA